MVDFQPLVYSICFLHFCNFCQFLRLIKIQFVGFQEFIYLKLCALLRSERCFEHLCVSGVEIRPKKVKGKKRKVKGERRKAKGMHYLSPKAFSRNVNFCIFWVFAKINQLIFKRSRI